MPLFPDPVIEAAFDMFLAHQPPLAPWIAQRSGPGLRSVDATDLKLPPGAHDWPTLDSIWIPSWVTGPGGDFHVPTLALPGGVDPAFSFAVTQTGEPSEAGGGVFNRATLSLTVNTVMSPFLAGVVAGPDGPKHMRCVPDLALLPTLVVPVTRQDGGSDEQRITGALAPAAPDGSVVVVFTLLGTQVEAAYLQLAVHGQARLEVDVRYSGYQPVAVVGPKEAQGIPGMVAAQGEAGFAEVFFEVWGNAGATGGGRWVGVPPPARDYRYFPATARVPRTLALARAFADNPHRARFTVTAGAMTRPIVDDDDLHVFAGPRSQFGELRSIADVPGKYPSLQRLYLGQVSGDVVAVPAAYGIQRTRTGLAARCDALVDDSPSALSGSRFHFTFTAAPMVDPVDLARLRADIARIPEAATRALQVVLPGGLDTRHPSTLDGAADATARFADGDGAGVDIAVDIGDTGATPATLNVGLFLSQLAAAAPGPLFGTLALRLDDDYPDPVQAELRLNLHATADGDELVIATPAGQPAATVTNAGPLDLVLGHAAATTTASSQPAVIDLHAQPLAAGQSAPVAAGDGLAVVAVSRALVVPTPLPRARLLDYLVFHTETVQQVQHPLTVNAVGIDFTAGDLSSIDVQFALAGAPAVAIAGLTLTASHRLDYTQARIPVDSAITGLQTQVALTLRSAGATRTVEVAHDFVDEPILVLTPAMLGQESAGRSGSASSG